MMYAMLILFALAAILGLTMLIKWFGKKGASRAVIYCHGLIAAIALVILILYAVQNPSHFPKVSLVLFIVAALGGFYMFFATLKNDSKPLGIALLHGLLAVGGFIALLLFALT